jgi:hypothetical protein
MWAKGRKILKSNVRCPVFNSVRTRNRDQAPDVSGRNSEGRKDLIPVLLTGSLTTNEQSHMLRDLRFALTGNQHPGRGFIQTGFSQKTVYPSSIVVVHRRFNKSKALRHVASDSLAGGMPDNSSCNRIQASFTCPALRSASTSPSRFSVKPGARVNARR